MSVAQRQFIEKKIVMKLANELRGHGFKLQLFADYPMEPLSEMGDHKAFKQNIMSCDEEFILAERTGENPVRGLVQLVYGNDGWDVIADYHTNLQPFMVETQKLIDSLM